LFIVGECEVSAHQAVAIVSEQHDARLLGKRVKRLQVGRMPARVDCNRHLDVTQYAVVRVRQHLCRTREQTNDNKNFWSAAALVKKVSGGKL